MLLIWVTTFSHVDSALTLTLTALGYFWAVMPRGWAAHCVRLFNSWLEHAFVMKFGTLTLWLGINKMTKKISKTGSNFLLTSSDVSTDDAENWKITEKVPINDEISITFDPDGVFTFCFQFLKEKGELFNIIALGFWKILIWVSQKFGPVFDLSAFFLVNHIK